jgi:hypothetical protein
MNYQLMYLESTTVQAGLMIVQMLTDSQIKIEVFAGRTPRRWSSTRRRWCPCGKA